jgi:hypothetical protein
MKRTFFQPKLRTLVAMFFLLGGMFFSANRAEAQSFNWMTQQEALVQLSAEIEQMSLDIQNFVPGSTQYKNLANHLTYYKLITVAIEEGKIVEVAVNDSLLHVNDQFDAMNKLLNKTTLTGLFDDATVLLTQ